MTARHDRGAATVEAPYDEASGGATAVFSTTLYYRAFGRIIATRTTTASGADVRYYVADHLGSTNAILAASGGVYVAGMKYWPFGAQRTGATPDHGYTGQLRDDYSTIGAYYYHARFYSTTLAHFMAADSVIPQASGRGLNRYAYANANPVLFNDPSGHCFTVPGIETFACGSSDALFWLDHAMSDDTWVGDIARWGLGTIEFWMRVGGLAADSPTLPITMIMHFGKAASADPSRWGRMPDLGWQLIGAGFAVSGEFLEASVFDWLFGTTATAVVAALLPDRIVGAYDLWERAAVFGYDQSLWEEFVGMAYRPAGPTLSAGRPTTIESLTLSVAPRLTVNEVERAWSDDQMAILQNAGYSPRRPRDWYLYWGRAWSGGFDLWPALRLWPKGTVIQ